MIIGVSGISLLVELLIVLIHFCLHGSEDDLLLGHLVDDEVPLVDCIVPLLF